MISYSLLSERDEPSVQQIQHDNNKPINVVNAAPHANQKLKPKNSKFCNDGFILCIIVSYDEFLSSSIKISFFHIHIPTNDIKPKLINTHANNIHIP